MRRPKRYWPIIVGISVTYTCYIDYLKPYPKLTQLPDNKKIVIIGGGLVGLSTAYYLC